MRSIGPRSQASHMQAHTSMDTTQVFRLGTSKAVVTSWENGPDEVFSGFAAQIQIPHEFRCTSQRMTRASALVALADQLERLAVQLREHAKDAK
jgi:hypothetical protein